MSAPLKQIKQAHVLPREKAVIIGITSLTDSELIGLLIRTGFHDSNVLDIADEILKKRNGLKGLINISSTELMEFKGIKTAKATNILAALELHRRLSILEWDKIKKVDSEYLYNKYRYLSTASSEHIVLVIMNSQKTIIYEEEKELGNELSIVCNPKSILKQVVRHNGKFFYLLHNHPSGNHSPSKNDILFTSLISIHSKLFEIKMLDHIIIGREGYYSFQKMKKL